MSQYWKYVSATLANAMLVASASALTVLSRTAGGSGHSNTDLILFGGTEGLGLFAFVVGMTHQVLLAFMMMTRNQKRNGMNGNDIYEDGDEDEDGDDGENEDDEDHGTDDEVYGNIPNGGTTLANNFESSINDNVNETSTVADITAPEPFDDTAFFDALREISRNETNSQQDEGALGDSTVLVPSASTTHSTLESESSMREDTEENEVSSHNSNNDNNIDDDEEEEEPDGEDEDEDHTEEIAIAQ